MFKGYKYFSKAVEEPFPTLLFFFTERCKFKPRQLILSPFLHHTLKFQQNDICRTPWGEM